MRLGFLSISVLAFAGWGAAPCAGIVPRTRKIASTRGADPEESCSRLPIDTLATRDTLEEKLRLARALEELAELTGADTAADESSLRDDSFPIPVGADPSPQADELGADSDSGLHVLAAAVCASVCLFLNRGYRHVSVDHSRLGISNLHPKVGIA